jgi:hypothetical protein
MDFCNTSLGIDIYRRPIKITSDRTHKVSCDVFGHVNHVFRPVTLQKSMSDDSDVNQDVSDEGGEPLLNPDPLRGESGEISQTNMDMFASYEADLDDPLRVVRLTSVGDPVQPPVRRVPAVLGVQVKGKTDPWVKLQVLDEFRTVIGYADYQRSEDGLYYLPYLEPMYCAAKKRYWRGVKIGYDANVNAPILDTSAETAGIAEALIQDVSSLDFSIKGEKIPPLPNNLSIKQYRLLKDYAGRERDIALERFKFFQTAICIHSRTLRAFREDL